MTGRARSTAPVLVGRATQQRVLRTALDGAAAGDPVCIVIHGEAGVGKTRLVREVVAAGDAEVLWGSCVRFGASMVPFAPLLTALRGFLPDATDPRESGRLLTMIASTIGALTECRSTVLVVDDLHWADLSSLDALAYLVAGFRQERLAIIATCRDEPPPDGHPLLGWLADMRRMPSFVELSLDRFELHETEQLVEELLESVADLDLVADIHARADGNPYLIELLVADLPAGAHALPPGAPNRLAEALTAMWHRLDPVARDVARIVAVGGRPVDYSVLAAVALGQGIGAEALDTALESAKTHGVLANQPGRQIWFRHPLLADVLYAAVPTGRATTLHAAFADVLAAKPGKAADLAVHCERSGAMDEAFAWCIEAADAAEAQHASAEAAQHLVRACAIWAEVSDHRRGSQRDRVDLLVRASVACGHVGRNQEARRLIGDALDLVDEVAEPLLCSRLLSQWCDAAWGHPGEARSVIDKRITALRLTDGHPDSPERCKALAALAQQEYHRQGDHAAARRHAAEALAAARRSGSDLMLATALSAWTLVSPEPRPEWRRHLDEMRRAAYAMQNGEIIVTSGFRLAGALEDECRFDEASEVLTRAFVESVRLGGRPQSYGLAAAAAADLLETGRFGEARRLLQEALAARYEGPSIALPRLIAAQLAIRTGRIAAARSHVARALEVVDPSFSPFGRDLLVTPAELSLAEGHPEEAVAWIRDRLETNPNFQRPANLRIAPGGELYDRDDAVVFRVLAQSLADLACRSRDSKRLHTAAEAAQELGSWEHVFRARLPGLGDGTKPPADPDLLLARAEIARCCADPDQTRHWQRAVDRCRETGLVWSEARALSHLAEAQIAGGLPRREVAAHIRRLHELATWMGAGPLREQAETLARVARVRLDAVPATVSLRSEDGVSTPLDHLTAREREILAYLVAGRTNNEIARSLVISEKTVSVHVTNILRKSGTSNRADAAAWAARLN